MTLAACPSGPRASAGDGRLARKALPARVGYGASKSDGMTRYITLLSFVLALSPYGGARGCGSAAVRLRPDRVHPNGDAGLPRTDAYHDRVRDAPTATDAPEPATASAARGLERGDTGGTGQPLQPCERASPLTGAHGHLHANELSGEIPAEMGSLSNLEDLRLRDNDLSGCVPGSLEDQLTRSNLGDLPFC